MLEINVPGFESYDSEKQIFTSTKDTKLQLEHSLISISKWESRWNVPFLENKKKTNEQTISYIADMVITRNFNPDILSGLTVQNYKDINEYINRSMTATTLPEERKKGGTAETITSELIYYWMIALNIPWECQKWHLDRLLTLIRVCNIKNAPPKKMSRSEIGARNREINARRKAELGTKG